MVTSYGVPFIPSVPQDPPYSGIQRAQVHGCCLFVFWSHWINGPESFWTDRYPAAPTEAKGFARHLVRCRLMRIENIAADVRIYIFVLLGTCSGEFLRTKPDLQMLSSNLTGHARLDRPRRKYCPDHEQRKLSEGISYILNRRIRVALQLYKPRHLLYDQSKLQKAEGRSRG